MEIRNLVFQGGGVKGSAYAGSVEVLEQRGLLRGVRRVAGTSAGAITASLLAAGADAAGLHSVVKETHFAAFLDGRWGVVGDVNRLIEHYGVYVGDEFGSILRTQIGRFCGDGEITFAGLRELAAKNPGAQRDLYVISTNVTQRRADVFCADTFPTLPIWQAVRASMSIPLMFEAFKLGTDYYVDGGLSWNFPIDLFDHDNPATAQPGANRPRRFTTLGFALGSKSEIDAAQGRAPRPPAQTEKLTEFLLALSEFMYEAANQAHVHPDDLPRTVFVDNLGVSATDFNASPAVIDALIDSGRSAANAYFAALDAVEAAKAAAAVAAAEPA